VTFIVEFQDLATGGWFGYQPAETLEEAQGHVIAELRTRGGEESAVQQVAQWAADGTTDMPEHGIAVLIYRA
jgi:hypothetical protein